MARHADAWRASRLIAGNNLHRQTTAEVSRYLAFMSLPVSYMVSITLSRHTRGSLVRRSAIRAALTAFTAAIALRSMHGTCTAAGDRVAGQAEVMLHSDLCRDAHLTRAAAQQFRQTGRRHRAGDPTSPGSRLRRRRWRRSSYTANQSRWRPAYSGPGVAVHLADKLVIVGQHRRHDTAGAVGWRGHHPAAGGVLFVHRRGEHIDPVDHRHRIAVGGVPLTSIRRSAAARRGTRSLPGRTPSVVMPRSIPALITSHTAAKCCSRASLLCSASSFCIIRPESDSPVSRQ